MSAADIRRARELLGMTQGQAARLLGVDARSWRRYEAGQRDFPAPCDKLLRLVLQSPAVLDQLLVLQEAA